MESTLLSVRMEFVRINMHHCLGNDHCWSIDGTFQLFWYPEVQFLPFLPIVYYCFRVSADIEIKGMDTEKHNEPAYPDIAKGHGYDKEINARLARNSVVPGDIPNLSYGKVAPSDV